MKIGVIGSGSWATAIVKILHENVTSLCWYARSAETREHIRRAGRNPHYLRAVKFNMEKIQVVDDINELVRNCKVVFIIVPSAFLSEWLAPLTEDLSRCFVVTAIKGIVPGEYVTATEYLKRHFGVSYQRMGVVSGPCHAEEVAMDRLSYLTVSCKELPDAARISALLQSSYIRTIDSTDIYGTEYSAILKNIYAIAAGMAHGLGYGDNFLSVLISNGQGELTRFLNASYPDKRTVSNSAYLGDLLVTCYSQFSRNRTFGAMIGSGYSVLSAQMEMNMVAEGYYATEGIHVINQEYKVDMPIANAMYNILYGGIHPKVEMRILTDKLL